MRVLITGASGFAGSHLAEFLLQREAIEVWGTMRSGPGAARHLEEQMVLRSVDLLDPVATREVVEECEPERIYHLAAQAFVPLSWEDPWPTLENNIRSQLNLLQAVVTLGLDTRILCVTSGESYGRIDPSDLPLDEETPFRPDSPYGVSKVAQDLLASQYYRSHGLYTVCARPFNHIGPRQTDRFVAPAFARQIAEIEQGIRPPVLMVGNLEAQRDFSDVRDVVRAYYLLLERGTPGEAYHVARGVAIRVRTLLEVLLSFTNVDIRVEQDPERLRPSDVPVSYADISKIQSATGWSPRVSFEESLRAVLEDWRERVAGELT